VICRHCGIPVVERVATKGNSFIHVTGGSHCESHYVYCLCRCQGCGGQDLGRCCQGEKAEPVEQIA
jgi:hypothetical protein